MKNTLLYLCLLFSLSAGAQTPTTKTLTVTASVKGYVVMDSVAFRRHVDSVVTRSRRIVADSLKKFRTIDYVKGEIPSGILDSANRVFALSGIPLLNSLEVYVDGDRVYDYTITSTTVPRKITLKSAPLKWVRVDYEKLSVQ